jgi:hypothetical protein
MQQPIKKPAVQEITAGFFLKNHNINNNETLPFCKIIPPYARKLLIAINHGYKPANDIFLYFGESAWDYAKRNEYVHDILILPPNKRPNYYDWSVVNMLPVLGIDTSIQGSGAELIEQLAFELLKYGAKIVRIILASNNLAIYRQGGEI